MALYPCPECKREISTDALSCPHCGKRKTFAMQWRALPKIGKIVIISSLCIFALTMCVSNKADKHAADKATAPAVQAAAASVTPKAPDGRMTIQPGDWFGYRDRDTLERATKLAVQGDREAYSKLMGNGVVRGICTIFKPGEEVFLEDTAMMAGVVKIRRKGEMSGWWTNYEAVK